MRKIFKINDLDSSVFLTYTYKKVGRGGGSSFFDPNCIFFLAQFILLTFVVLNPHVRINKLVDLGITLV